MTTKNQLEFTDKRLYSHSTQTEKIFSVSFLITIHLYLPATNDKRMNAERWQKIKVILEEAIEVSPSQRAGYLEKSCAGDRDLRREVQELLDFEDEPAAKALEQDVFSALTTNGFSADSKKFIGRKVNNYTIVAELGAGGMGMVFLAERNDGEFDQRVALKVIKRGMDSEAVLRRFINERQILASLKHPNIAHLINGGTTDDGLPYFVMEYVEGDTILENAALENLDLDARLNLFRKVCAAVSFAHQNLVIHRDLKPSNILITKNGEVKLLDFGIAKLLKNEADNLMTATQIQAFTPEYASPEQVRGEKLTTASDVYSLGVILHELLTGVRPFETGGLNIGEIIKSVCETEPVRPSSIPNSKFRVQNLRSNKSTDVIDEQETNNNQPKTDLKSQISNLKFLRGDLDNIILKALRKEPERRYSSVEQFSEDVRRHQQGLPVTASKDTWKYRTSKFLKRNKISVVSATLILISLIAGITTSIYQAKNAQRERLKAEQRFNDVRRLANSFMFEINEEIQKSPIKAREMLVARALEYLDKLSAESGNDAELESELASAYEKIGSIQSELFNPNAGKTSDALESHQKSLEIREKLFRAEPQNVSRGIATARSRALVADILSMSGRIAEASENYRRAIEINEQLLTVEPSNISVRFNLASVYSRLGQSTLRSGSLGSALENYEKSLAIYHSLSSENPSDPKFSRYVSYVYSYIGYVKIEMGKSDEAVRFFTDSLSITKKLFGICRR